MYQGARCGYQRARIQSTSPPNRARPTAKHAATAIAKEGHGDDQEEAVSEELASLRRGGGGDALVDVAARGGVEGQRTGRAHVNAACVGRDLLGPA